MHSPGRYRTKGVIMNSPEFSADFGCKLDSPMNPRRKCSVWSTPTIAKDNLSSKTNEKIKLSKLPIFKEIRVYDNQNVSTSMSFPLSSLIRRLLAPVG